ncbi:MAG: helicase [Acidobacteria bacterium]|nr:helicase [Acidobacteriota bacterium]
MGRKQREAITEALAAVPGAEQRVILATGSYIGEGFDDARLDTLFLAMPISWRGTLQQYVGRLHRLHDNKRVVRVYDYVDTQVPMLARMYERRLRGYQAIGYTVEPDFQPKGRTSWLREQKVLLRVKVDWGDIAGS